MFSRTHVVAAVFTFVCSTFLATPAFATELLPAPPLVLPTSNGELDLGKLRGRVVYLDFWASWCGPCRKSFPWMSDMQARYGGQGLSVVAVNLDQDRALADRFLAAYKPGFTVAYDQQGVSAEKYEVKGMPSSYLIDRAGRIHTRHVGFREQEKARLEDEIRTLVQADKGGLTP